MRLPGRFVCSLVGQADRKYLVVADDDGIAIVRQADEGGHQPVIREGHVMGVETLETEELQRFTLKTYSGTGIQYLVRDGEEGRGGKVLLQSQADIEKYEALAEAYFNKYPNLIHDKNAAYIWADLEIKGLAQHTNNGIISMGFNGMSYNDNADYKFEIGKGIVLREGTDVTIFATGLEVAESLGAAEKLAADGISAKVINIHTIKPLDKELVIAAAKETGKVVTVEEHSVIGGLGSAICDVLSE